MRAPTPAAGLTPTTTSTSIGSAVPNCAPRPLPSGVTVDHFPGRALPTVVAASTLIVIGQAEPSTEIVNLALGDTFAIGQVYTITVQRYLKGSGPHTLKVIQWEGDLDEPAACVTARDIVQTKTLYANDFIPLRANTDYLFLLTRPPLRWCGWAPPVPCSGLSTDYFIGTDRRWRWRLQADGTGVLEVIGYTFPAEPTPTWSDSAPIVPQIETLISQTSP
jgi:hypothetical protein